MDTPGRTETYRHQASTPDPASPEPDASPRLPWASERPARAWDRRPDENDRQFAAFRAYLRRPATARRLKEIAAEMGVAHQTIKEWSATNDWASRARSYDNRRDSDLENVHQARLRRAVAERSAAILAGVAAIRLGVQRIFEDLKADPDHRLKPSEIGFLQWSLNELRLSQGEATSIERTEISEARDAISDALERIASRREGVDTIPKIIAIAEPEQAEPEPAEETAPAEPVRQAAEDDVVQSELRASGWIR